MTAAAKPFARHGLTPSAVRSSFEPGDVVAVYTGWRAKDRDAYADYHVTRATVISTAAHVDPAKVHWKEKARLARLGADASVFPAPTDPAPYRAWPWSKTGVGYLVEIDGKQTTVKFVFGLWSARETGRREHERLVAERAVTRAAEEEARFERANTLHAAINERVGRVVYWSDYEKRAGKPPSLSLDDLAALVGMEP